MIALLKGVIEHIEGSEILLDCRGVGYIITLGVGHLQALDPMIGDNVKMVIYQLVKETELTLLGFMSFDEREIFKLLLTVKGVGAKAAMKIVDSIPADEIVDAIKKRKIMNFTNVKGIGKKTAERIIDALKNKKKILKWVDKWKNSNSNRVVSVKTPRKQIF